MLRELLNRALENSENQTEERRAAILDSIDNLTKAGVVDPECLTGKRDFVLKVKGLFDYYPLMATQLHNSETGLSIKLTSTLNRIFATLAQHPNTIVPKGYISERVWGGEDVATEYNLRTHVMLLRKRISDTHGRLIQTARGGGYQLTLPKESFTLEGELPDNFFRKNKSC